MLTYALVQVVRAAAAAAEELRAERKRERACEPVQQQEQVF